MYASREFGVVQSHCGNCLDFGCDRRTEDNGDVVLANALVLSTFDIEKRTRVVVGDCYASGKRVAHDFSHVPSNEVEKWLVDSRLGQPVEINHGAAFDVSEAS